MGARSLLTKLGSIAALGGAVAIACVDDPHLRTTPEQAAGTLGGACEAQAGKLPAPDCDNSDKRCEESGCTIDEARCGSKATCLPLGDNRGKDVLDFRVRRLNIAAPPALASDFIQSTIVTLNVDLAEKACGENGKGLFSWILRVDRTAGTLMTGGTPPTSDPLGRGFCFASVDIGGTRVEPVTVKIAFDGNTFKSAETANVKIPIFLSTDLSSAVILPIRDVILEGVSLSAEGNCIGAFNERAVDSQCADDKSLCSKWTTAGSLGGHITLEEADKITIRDLNDKSLCAFLAAEPTQFCARDAQGVIVFKGDYCGKNKQAGGCGDAVWLAATFAASAARIFEDPAVPGCLGSSPKPAIDAGIDAADASLDAPTDAPSDAATDASVDAPTEGG